MNLRTLIPQSVGGDKENIFNMLFGDGSEEWVVAWQAKNRKPLWDWVAENRPENIMEVGFGHGMNAFVILALSPESEYYLFDTMNWDESQLMWDVLKQRENVRLFEGDTRETLPKNIRKLPMMDLIFIDGGHNYKVIENDWRYSKELMHENTAVFFHGYVDWDKEIVGKSSGSYRTGLVETKVGPNFLKVKMEVKK